MKSIVHFIESKNFSYLQNSLVKYTSNMLNVMNI